MDIHASNLFDLGQAQLKAAKDKTSLENLSTDSRDIREIAEEFESVFITTMLESMFAGIKTDGPFGGGHGEQIYRSMMNEQYALAIAKSGGIGIADHIQRDIIKLQEAHEGD